jgi:hypothetical protein
VRSVSDAQDVYGAIVLNGLGRGSIAQMRPLMARRLNLRARRSLRATSFQNQAKRV